MKNYSETYAAAITTYAPVIVLMLGFFGIDVLESDVVLILSATLATTGFVWQLVQRFKKGDITKLGFKK